MKDPNRITFNPNAYPATVLVRGKSQTEPNCHILSVNVINIGKECNGQNMLLELFKEQKLQIL